MPVKIWQTADGPIAAQSGKEQMDQSLHTVARKEWEKIKRTTKQKMATRHSKEEGNYLEQESIIQTTMIAVDGWLHPAANRQSLREAK